MSIIHAGHYLLNILSEIIIILRFQTPVPLFRAILEKNAQWHYVLVFVSRGMNIYTFAYTIYLLTRYCNCILQCHVKESYFRNVHEIMIYVSVSIVRFSFVLYIVYNIIDLRGVQNYKIINVSEIKASQFPARERIMTIFFINWRRFSILFNHSL